MKDKITDDDHSYKIKDFISNIQKRKSDSLSLKIMKGRGSDFDL
jgi:hypothetical protein